MADVNVFDGKHWVLSINQSALQLLLQPAAGALLDVTVTGRFELVGSVYIAMLLRSQSQMDGVNNWMNEIDVFLKSEEAALGDLETLQAQLTESEVATILYFHFT